MSSSDVEMEPANDDGVEVDNEDTTVCNICLSGEVFDNNEILFCDKCNVAVHQVCYGVKQIPPGSWFCYPCSEHLDPSTLRCELCPFTGGAYKRCDTGSKWVHPICANWVPEVVEEVDAKAQPLWFTLRYVTKDRFKLRCSICQKKGGACVQCAYGRCTVAAHAWCALRNAEAGFKNRIVKVGENANNWEIFCRTHAANVADPVKIKKHRPVSSLPPLPPATSSSSSSFAAPAAIAAKADFDSVSSVQTKTPRPRTTSGNSLGNKNRTPARKERYREASSSSSSSLHALYGGAKPPLPILCAAETDEPRRVSEREEQFGRESVPGAAFPVLSLSDWPGISEGEGLSTEHFWNYVSSCFPEDHTHAWLEHMMSMALPLKNWTVESDPVMSSEPTVPADLNLEEYIDDINNSFRTDKEMRAATSAPRRQEFLDALQRIVLTLNRDLAQRAHTIESVLGLRANIFADDEDLLLRDARIITHTTLSHKKNQEKEEDKQEEEDKEDEREGVVLRVLFDGALHRYAAEFVVRALQSESDAERLAPLSVSLSRPAAVQGTAEGEGERETHTTRWHAVPLSLCDGYETQTARALFESVVMQARQLLSRRDTAEEVEEVQRISAGADGEIRCAAVALHRWESLSDDAEPLLAVGPLTKRSHKEEEDEVEDEFEEEGESGTTAVVVRLPAKRVTLEDELSQCIARDQRAFAALAHALYSHTTSLAAQCRAVADNSAKYRGFCVTEKRYVAQQQWKRVSLSLARGLRDQRADFNKAEDDPLPASWAIGRADPALAGAPGGAPGAGQGADTGAAKEGEEESAEDAVCMCCFDGSSDEQNKILFCDGCNASLHQVCYGVHEIPEGDYFCERCVAVQHAARALGNGDVEEVAEQFDVRRAVTCCLCPVTHGGLKRVRRRRHTATQRDAQREDTESERVTEADWAHLGCVWWATERAKIGDLSEMREIDLSALSYNPLAAPATQTQLRRQSLSLSQSLSQSLSVTETAESERERCAVCGWAGGLLRVCNGRDCESGSCEGALCGTALHPLCAWFAGCVVRCALTDPTFLGRPLSTRSHNAQGEGEEDELLCGEYPAGLSLSLFCERHSDAQRIDRERERLRRLSPPTESAAAVTEREPYTREEAQSALSQRTEQAALRGKYRLSERDLDRVPLSSHSALSQHQRQRQRQRQRRKTESGGAGGGAAQRNLGSSVGRRREREKERERECLAEDAYSPSQCAVCMRALSVRALCGVGSVYESERVCEALPAMDVSARELCVDCGCGRECAVHGDALSASTQPAHTTPSSTQFDHTSPSPWSALRCAVCSLSAHVECVQQHAPHTLPRSESERAAWRCELCRENARERETRTQRERERDCALCPRRGGLLVRTQDAQWVHPLCVRHAPPALVSLSLYSAPTPLPSEEVVAVSGDVSPHNAPSQRVVVELHNAIVEKAIRRHKCVLCNRRNGYTVSCCAPGCTAQLHPLCGVRSATALVRTRHGLTEAFCAQHAARCESALSGSGSAAVTAWPVDTAEVHRLRGAVERARLITDLVLKRERLKRSLCRAESESAALAVLRELAARERDRATERETETESHKETETEKERDSASVSVSLSPSLLALLDELGVPRESCERALCEAEEEEESDETEKEKETEREPRPEDNEFVCVSHIPLAPSQRPLAISLGDKEGEGEGESAFSHSLSISAHWTRNGRVAAPRSLTVSLAGVEVSLSPAKAARTNEKDFIRRTLSQVAQQRELSRATTRLFSSSKQEALFAREIAPSLSVALSLSQRDFVRAAKAAGLEIEVKKKKETEKGTEKETEKEKEKESDREKEGEGETAAPATARKRGRTAFFHNEIETKRETERETEAPKETEKEQSRKRSKATPKESEKEKETESEWLRAARAEWSRVASLSLPRELLRLLPFEREGEKERETETETETETHTTTPSHKKKRARTAAERESEKETERETERETKRVRERHCVDDALSLFLSQNASLSLSEWNIPSQRDALPLTLAQTERVIQHTLSALSQHPLDDEPSSSQRAHTTHSRSSSRSIGATQHAHTTRTMEDDFLSIPKQTMPDYGAHVRRAVTLESVRVRLREHGYACVGEFTLDVLTMLNNARTVTAMNNYIWKDTKKLAALLESYKSLALSSPRELPLVSPHDWTLSVTRCEDDENKSENDVTERCVGAIATRNRKKQSATLEKRVVSLHCGCCLSKFTLSPWPSTLEVPSDSVSLTGQSASQPQHTRRHTRKSISADDHTTLSHNPPRTLDSQWQWLCEECVSTQGEALCGSAVRVWWPDDACAYEGVVNAFDGASHCHRVLYQDGEWEFVPLAREVFLLCAPSGK